MSILVVDDDKAHLEALGDLLQLEGFSILRASSPEDALPLFDKHLGAVALAIVDLEMPGIGGEGLIRELLASSCPPEIIVLTGSDDHSDTVRRVGSVVREILYKPAMPEQMMELARSIVIEWGRRTFATA
ncbi:MAG: response regulator [Candidatus Wallbacteria bacterium]|nr:response regulator [Candidatus Wallbacteria bacterium]